MTISVVGSSSHHSSRSFEETSALLPIDTNAERPRPLASARSSTASPRAPLCEEKPIFPVGNARGAKVALRRTDAEAMPRQFGPTMRAPCSRDERDQLLLPHRVLRRRSRRSRRR